LAFSLVSLLVLSSSLNQVQLLVVSGRPSRPSGSCAGRWAKNQYIHEINEYEKGNLGLQTQRKIIHNDDITLAHTNDILYYDRIKSRVSSKRGIFCYLE
jgi:hypothetical protein